MNIHIIEAIERELRDWDDTRVFPHAHDKLLLLEAKRHVANAMYRLMCGDVFTARMLMEDALRCLVAMGLERGAYFYDVMVSIQKACEKRRKELEKGVHYGTL